MNDQFLSPDECAELLGRLLDPTAKKVEGWNKLLGANYLWEALARWIDSGRFSSDVANSLRNTLADPATRLGLFDLGDTGEGSGNNIARLGRLNATLGAAGQMITAAEATVSGSTASETGPFVSAFVAPVKSARVPIAVVDKDGKGKVATLELQLIPGEGEAVQHPGDLLSTRVAANFAAAMSAAFAAARSLAAPSADGQAVDHLGRWQVIDRLTGVPIPSLEGPSASGAAFYCCHALLAGMVCDPRVIVIAEAQIVRGDSPFVTLREVDGIVPKVRAVAEAADIEIDTVAVVRGRNLDEAAAICRPIAKRLQVVELPYRMDRTPQAT